MDTLLSVCLFLFSFNERKEISMLSEVPIFEAFKVKMTFLDERNCLKDILMESFSLI